MSRITISGGTFTEIKKMVSRMYGACYWTRDRDGGYICFPTATMVVQFVPTGNTVRE